ncbi:Exportin-T [Taphrina deformans PYCC 5710]|uniref:Exportin-T n=1 Tax=Taphrina deformans (strain PYCC 5710 / ATCC 11124 / CBS 356.35 / IMI 108563 / JCM 9778 / NBRC 8474) TaxID=1097556 RepID=R4X6R2_TAPDE|nr:Exportin-T [Taphrina deformans PYCC 5710]|eukprot:CCG80882.1 Exportin-T [Taphrina deformans PYCC 5710]
MEDDFERAVEIALRFDSDSHVRQQAMNFCDQIKTSKDGWQTCLNVFIQSKRRTENSRFYTLQVLEDRLRSHSFELGEANMDYMRQVLTKWNSESIANASDTDPAFLRNKLASIYSLLFVHLYTSTWQSFFDELIRLMFGNSQISSSSNPRAVDFFFRVCIAIEQEIADVLIVRSAEEAQRSTIIKDEIRKRDMAKLPEIWFTLFAQYREADKNIVALGLRVVGAWVSWIDIALIVNEPFMSFLFELLQDTELRNPACDALVGIVSKKMNANDKTQLITLLNLPNLMHALESGISDDPDFAENVARLVNAETVELTRAITKDELPRESVQHVTGMIYNLVPYVLTFLANEYDETSAAVFPAVNDILTMIRKANSQDDATKSILSSLLQAIVLKMKYDETSDWGEDSDAVEDAEFGELRAKLKSYQDMIQTIDFGLYTNVVSSLVNSSLQDLHKNDWRQLELALYSLFHYGEALRSVRTLPKDTTLRERGQGELNALLAKLVNSEASSYPHASIQDHYFEIAVRYSSFFEDKPNELMRVLSAFIDQRGLHHPTSSVQFRSWYLFSRFVKSLAAKIGDANIGRQVLDAIQDLLVIDMSSTEDLDSDSDSDAGLGPGGNSDPFENRLYLFEAVGTLVSIKAVSPAEQAQLGMAVMSPLFTNIEKAVSSGTTDKASRLFLQHNIMAIGRFAQGFPTDNKIKAAGEQWDPIFEQASEYILAAFDAQVSHANIRDATRFAFARIVNIQDSRMAAKMPRLVAGMIEKSDITQLAEFLPFLGQLVFKLKPAAHPVLDEAMSPLFTRLFQLLGSPTEGTDDIINLCELKKAYLMFVLTIFGNEHESVFVSGKNQAAFEPFVSSVVHYASDTADPGTQKIAFSVLREMLVTWCTHTIEPRTPEVKSSSSQSTPLDGFDQFLYSTIIPLCFEVPAKPAFNLKDATTAQVVAEIATVQKSIVSIQGPSCIQKYLNGVGLGPEKVNEYGIALQTMDQKRFKAFFKQFCHDMY